MTTETTIQAEAATDAPAKVVKALATTTDKVVTETVKTAKTARAAAKRRSKRTAKRVAKVAKPAVARKVRATKTARKTIRKTSTAARKPAAAAFTTRIPTMNFIPNTFPGFEAFSGSTPFQSLFADAGERSQDAVKKSQKVAQVK